MKSRSILMWFACAAALAWMSGCGGGGEGGVKLSGTVTTPPSRDVVANATVKAYAWPVDPTKPVGQATTDARGRYTMSLSGDLSNQDIVVIAEQGDGAQKIRLATIVNDLSGSKTGVDLDAATTLAAENIADRAKNVSNLTGPAVATIIAELRKLDGLTRDNLLVGGSDLPAVFGGGLKTGSVSDTFIKADKTIDDEFANIEESGGDVLQAKRLVQMLRDLVNGVANPMNDEATSLQNALQEQAQTIKDGTQTAHDFASRFGFVGDLLGLSGNGTAESLAGKTPGKYNQVVQVNQRILQRVGDTADGKSWDVVSQVPGLTQNMEMILTPKNSIPTFELQAAAGSFTLTVRKSDDSALKYDGTLNVAQTGTQGTPTQVTLTLTLQDKNLTQPITFNGTLTGVPASGSTQTDPAYTQLVFAGDLTSQFGTVHIGNATAQWFTSSANNGDVKLMQLTDLKIATSFSKPATLNVSSAIVNFLAADPANGWPQSTPQSITFTGSLTGSGQTLSVSNFVLNLTRVTNNKLVPSKIQGAVNFTGTDLAFAGNVDGTWNNPTGNKIEKGMAIADFPSGSLRFVGNLTPQFGTPSSVDLTLTSSHTTTAGTVSLAVTNLAFGDESIRGSITAVYDASDGTVQGNPNVTVDLTESPTGVKLTASGPVKTLAGTIVKGTTTLANIDKAGNLGLGDLGADTIIIKYTDNTFETASSILPK
jgi:hypothetical protein